MNTEDRFKLLLTQYLDGKLSNTQLREFFDLLAGGLYDHLVEANIYEDLQSQMLSEKLTLGTNASDRILKNILNAEKQPDHNVAADGSKVYRLRTLFSAAAVLMLVSSVALYFYLTADKSKQFLTAFVAQHQHQTKNNTKELLPVNLPDGSLIVLQPQSTLFYNDSSFNHKRSVYLDGEAVFNIAKDARHPFAVYYDKIVTSVLGTSFKIKTNILTKNVEVEVYTGKVKVYENEKTVAGTPSAGLIVTPNYKAVYQATSHAFKATLVDHPQPIKDNENRKIGADASPVSFVFENASISTVLKKLEENYGIEIAVSNEALKNCVFSGDITRQDLFNKLNVLCLATSATYEVAGTKIMINGKGCNNY